MGQIPTPICVVCANLLPAPSLTHQGWGLNTQRPHPPAQPSAEASTPTDRSNQISPWDVSEAGETAGLAGRYWFQVAASAPGDKHPAP